jgi:pantoate--beta-alanine ligase
MISVARTITDIRLLLRPRRSGVIGFVPTMGALHAGHARLIDVAREQSRTVVVSIFVNPLQFDQPSDYERYQRTLNADIALAAASGAHLIFAPEAGEMYPAGAQTFVDVEGLTEHFCGASRPGHFRGVTTVVAKLFHILEPTLAVFGEKDAQQLAVIQQMVADLNFPVTILGVPTVREPDGLAMSSRNARLSPPDRAAAVCLYQALGRARDLIAAGERDVERIRADAGGLLAGPGVELEYFDLADPRTMRPVTAVTGPVRAMGAIRIGGTRLIDNLLCG